MRILFVRHGESDGNLHPQAYHLSGDSKLGLTEKGWWQVYHVGQFLHAYYPEQGVTDWPTLYLSPHFRTRQSLSGIIHGLDGLFPGIPKLYADGRLAEKFFGATSLLHAPSDSMDPDVIAALLQVSRVIHQNEPYISRALMGELSKDTQAFVKSLIDGSLRRDIESGKDEFLFTVHGEIIRAFLVSWLHLNPQADQRLATPGNGDVIELSGTSGAWTVTKIFDGATNQRVKLDFLGGQKPLSFADLPAVPDFLKAQP